MGKLVKEGVNSFKFFLAYSGSLAVTDDQLISGFRRSKELGALPIVSCRPFCSLHPFSLLHSQFLFLLTQEDHLVALICFISTLMPQVLLQVHCENAAALVDAQQRVFDMGFTGPEGHFISRPAVFEV